MDSVSVDAVCNDPVVELSADTDEGGKNPVCSIAGRMGGGTEEIWSYQHVVRTTADNL